MPSGTSRSPQAAHVHWRPQTALHKVNILKNEAQQEEDAENSHVIAQVNDDNDIDNQGKLILIYQ